MSALQDLDDARETYKRMKGFDKTARRMVFGGIAAATASIVGVTTISIQWNFGILGGILSVIVGIMLFVFVNVDNSYKEHGDRLTRAKRALRAAEAVYEREMGVR